MWRPLVPIFVVFFIDRTYTQHTNVCPCDREGSWSIGFLQGPSPFELRPVGGTPHGMQAYHPSINCSSISSPPVAFVADPFLWVSNNALYAFYEYKSKATEKGEIGVAISRDKGISWQHLGTALSEAWHLSYPFVFLYQGEVYMLPEGYQSGSLRLYHATEFPLKWEFDRVLYERPLVDASIVKYQGMFWMFASDQDRTAQLCGQLELYHAATPLGPWTPHAANPVLNGDPSCGARPGGRPLVYQHSLYRFAQDCGGAYGKALLAYRVDVLNTTHFVQTPVKHNLPVGWWNAGRLHHLDAHQMPDGRWVALMDGDRGPECPGEYDFVQETCECRPRVVVT